VSLALRARPASISAALVRRADSALVKLVPSGSPGERPTPDRTRPGVTDPAADLPAEKTTYAMRDVASLAAARRHGDAVGVLCGAAAGHRPEGTRMRQRLPRSGMVRRYGPRPGRHACARAMDLDVVNVTEMPRCWRRPRGPPGARPPATAADGARFARRTRPTRVPDTSRQQQRQLIPGREGNQCHDHRRAGRAGPDAPPCGALKSGRC